MLKNVIIGFCAGLVCGLFGAGGGMILVPGFTYMLNLDAKEARATSVFAILPMTIVSMLFYFNANFIDWSIATKVAVGGIIGGYIGSKILKKAKSENLQLFFIFFLVYASLKMIFF